MDEARSLIAEARSLITGVRNLAVESPSFIIKDSNIMVD